MTAADQDRAGGQASGPSPGALMADVVSGITRLVQGEVALAKAEVVERLQPVKRSLVYVGIAVIVGITAVNVLAAMAVAVVVALGVSPIWASALVGGALLLLAVGLALAAAQLLREAGSTPTRTATSVRRDVETLQTMVKNDAT